MVGSVRPTMKRREIAGGLLEQAETRDDPRKATLARLAYHGFAPWSDYRFDGRCYGHVVADVRERDWRWRTEPDKAFAEHLSRSSGRPDGRTEEDMMQDIEDRIHEWYPYLFRGRKHF